MPAGANFSFLVPDQRPIGPDSLIMEFDTFREEGRVAVFQILYRGLLSSSAALRLEGGRSGRRQWARLPPCPDIPAWSWGQSTFVAHDGVLNFSGNRLVFFPAEEVYWVSYVLLLHMKHKEAGGTPNADLLKLR